MIVNTAIDLETTNRGPKHLGPSPYFERNRILCAGYYNSSWQEILSSPDIPSSGVNRIIFHNAPFDVGYMLRNPKHKRFFEEERTQIWDTMVVQNFLDNHTRTWVPLDQLAVEYLGEKKLSETVDVANLENEDPKKVREYCLKDCELTYRIFEKQLAEVERRGMLALINSRLRALKETILAEYNGMLIDVELAEKSISDTDNRIQILTEKLSEEMFSENPALNNPNSSQQVASYLFGGETKVTIDDPVLDEAGEPVRYKSGLRVGQVKTKKKTACVPVQGVLRGVTPKLTPGGQPSVDAKALAGIDHPFINDLLLMKELTKERDKLIEITKMADMDNLVHGSINHAGTRTGRLSSSNPNLQNLTSKDVE